jgi:site-specific DNA-cytosine methylase
MHCDIGKLKLEDLPEEWRHPDVVWCGIDCSTFSVAAISRHRRKNPDTGNLDPISDKAKQFDKIAEHTKELVAQMNPKIQIWENPRGGLRSMIYMQDLHRATTTYCQYGFPYMKPTDFFSNIELPLRKPCKNGDPCHERAPRGSRHGLQGVKGAVARAVYPPELVNHIVSICEDYIGGIK